MKFMPKSNIRFTPGYIYSKAVRYNVFDSNFTVIPCTGM